MRKLAECSLQASFHHLVAGKATLLPKTNEKPLIALYKIYQQQPADTSFNPNWILSRRGSHWLPPHCICLISSSYRYWRYAALHLHLHPHSHLEYLNATSLSLVNDDWHSTCFLKGLRRIQRTDGINRKTWSTGWKRKPGASGSTRISW